MSKAKDNIIPLVTNVTQLDFALLTANSVLDVCGRYFDSVLAIQPLPANQRLSLVANVHVRACEWRQSFPRPLFCAVPLKNKDQFLTVSWLWTAFSLKTMLGVCRKPMKCAFSRYRKRISEDRTRDLKTNISSNETQNYYRPMCSECIDYSVFSTKKLLQLWISWMIAHCLHSVSWISLKENDWIPGLSQGVSSGVNLLCRKSDWILNLKARW